MKTQISRNSFQAQKRYAGVYQQQGRMLTDADWNNLVDVLKGHLAEALKDVVGNGSPRDGKLTITSDRRIQPGDLYVDGLRAALPGTDPIDADKQEDYPGSPNLPATGPYVIYADVWERSVTALEDAALRDAGLNGADTCTRTQTMLQVKACPEDVKPENDIPQKGDAALTLTLHSNLDSGDACDPCAGQIEDGGGRIGNYLFRVEVHAVEGPADEPTRLKLKWSSENGAEQYAALDEGSMPPGFVTSRFLYEFFNLTTEKHLGVFLGTGFTPTWGDIKTVYEIPAAPPKEFVRRWDGFCVLSRSGSNWSLIEGFDKGVPLSTTVANTAPGYVSLEPTLEPTLRVNLEALRLVLELEGRTFVAGDYWLAPVREAEHGPGSKVLDEAPPEGIIHHYLRLARVAADGTMELFENDADRRRHSFPPLTDLWASDVDYKTDCDNEQGLFQGFEGTVKQALDKVCELAAEHIHYQADCSQGLFQGFEGTVKQALDKVCELAAEHIHYQADCSQGLFQGFEGTVKQALDKVCTIQAGNVFFAKPCDTSVYQGQTVNTVEDVLKLLCNVQAGQIAYQPGAGCTALPSGTQTVQVALDALCARPAGGGGCRITIGEGGIFPTLEEAIKKLLEAGERDMCLCLLPGEHTFGGEWENSEDRLNLSITGCGAGSKVVLKDALTFIGLTSLKLENFAIDGMKADLPLTVEGCSEVDISNLHHAGLAQKNPLIRVSGGDRVRLEENILETYTKDGLKEKESGLLKPQKVFAFDKQLADLYAIPLRNDFLGPAGERAEAWAGLHQNERLKIAGDILAGFEGVQKEPENLRFTLDEEVAYQRLMEVLTSLAVDALALLDGLREVRDQAHHAAAGMGVIFMDAFASIALEDNTVFGGVGFYGAPGDNDFSSKNINKLEEMLQTPEKVVLAYDASLQAWDNRITRLSVGVQMIDEVQKLMTGERKEPVQGLYRTALFESNIIASSGNQLLFENLTLAANEFETLLPSIGWVVGKTAIYTGNRVRQTINYGTGQEVGGGKMQTAARDQAKAANLPKGSW